MWKFLYFSVTQILCEINFGDSRSAKTAILTVLKALNFDVYVFLQFLNDEIYQIGKIQNPKNGKKGSFSASRFSKIDFT